MERDRRWEPEIDLAFRPRAARLVDARPLPARDRIRIPDALRHLCLHPEAATPRARRVRVPMSSWPPEAGSGRRRRTSRRSRRVGERTGASCPGGAVSRGQRPTLPRRVGRPLGEGVHAGRRTPGSCTARGTRGRGGARRRSRAGRRSRRSRRLGPILRSSAPLPGPTRVRATSSSGD